MLSAINVPKSKSITIAFVALKAMALGMVVTLKFKQAGNKCESNVIHLSDLTWVFFLLGGLLDFLSPLFLPPAGPPAARAPPRPARPAPPRARRPP